MTEASLTSDQDGPQPATHYQLKSWLTEAEDFLKEPRDRQRRDEDWYHDCDEDQWAKSEKRELKERGQLITIFNEIKPKIDFQIGMEQRARTDPKALPRGPQQEGMAEVATDVLVYIDDTTGFNRIASTTARDLSIAGNEAAEVVWDGEEIKIEPLRSDEFFFDPRSSRDDFTDARFIGYSRWFDLDTARALYPDHADKLNGMYSQDGEHDVFRDRPDFWAAGVGDRRRLRIVVMYYTTADGAWHMAHFTGVDALINDVSPYLDGEGKPDCAIAAQSRYVSRTNERYGDVRGVISAQRMINHYLAKVWSLISNRKTWGNPGVVVDINKFKREMTRVDGHVESNGTFGTNWGLMESNTEVQGLIMLIQEARSHIQRQGPNSAMMGRGTEGQSGRAILAQQDAGATEKNGFLDTHNAWKEQVYRKCFARAKQFWTEPMFIRVADDEEKTGQRFVGVNEPMMDEVTGQPQVDMERGEIAMRNRMGDIDVDVIIDSVPDFANLQSEEFEKISQMVQAGLPIPPTAVVEASNLREKRKVLKEMRGETDDPQAQEQQQMVAQMQQEAAQLEMALKNAETQEKTAQAQLRAAQAKHELVKMQETQAKADKTRAETTVIPLNARRDAMESAHRMASQDNPQSVGL